MKMLKHKKEVAEELKLTDHELMDIAHDIEQKIKIGLAENNTEIKCLPTFIPSARKMKNGCSYVLDLGGSNLRAAVVSFENGIPRFEKSTVETRVPWERNVSFPREKFLEMQGRLLSSLHYPETCPMGYCFSFPATSLLNRDAKLVRWTKGIHVPGTVGQNIGRMLLEHLNDKYKDIRVENISVINDTIASLFSGLLGAEMGAHIGLIVGTGTNMATFVDAEKIPKLKAVKEWRGLTPLNLESGNFHPPYLTKWDDLVDENSENKGQQRFEKAVSGMYLGRIFKSIFPNSEFDPGIGAKGLVEMLNNPTKYAPDQILISQLIYKRSAQFVGTSLAGLIKLRATHRSIHRVRIVAEGSLFWSRVAGKNEYKETTKKTLEKLIAMMGLSQLSIEFLKIKDSNLIGTAMAALL